MYTRKRRLKNELKIEFFESKFRFLSNFFICEVPYDQFLFNSSESAYQAQKTQDIVIQKSFIPLSPLEAKRKGKQILLRHDWENVKERFMFDIVLNKFSFNPNLQKKLLETGSLILEEGNTWRDAYWGIYNGYGLNRLGIILMQVRKYLKCVKRGYYLE